MLCNETKRNNNAASNECSPAPGFYKSSYMGNAQMSGGERRLLKGANSLCLSKYNKGLKNFVKSIEQVIAILYWIDRNFFIAPQNGSTSDYCQQMINSIFLQINQ